MLVAQRPVFEVRAERPFRRKGVGPLSQWMRQSIVRSVDNKELNSGWSIRTMRFCVVGHLIARTRGQRKLPPICKLCLQFTFQAKQDMTLCAPMIGKVTGTVFDKTDSDIVELLCAPGSRSRFPLVFGRLYLRPNGDAERDVFHLHVHSPAWRRSGDFSRYSPTRPTAEAITTVNRSWLPRIVLESSVDAFGQTIVGLISDERTISQLPMIVPFINKATLLAARLRGTCPQLLSAPSSAQGSYSKRRRGRRLELLNEQTLSTPDKAALLT